MSLVFSIASASDAPIYRQIVQHIQRAVAQGRLRPGEQLPAVRTLAESLVVNPNTVARAYQELIRDGSAESRTGVGVFIGERRRVFSKEERLRRLGQGAEQLAHEALILDFALPEVQAELEKKWRALQPETMGQKTNLEGRKK